MSELAYVAGKYEEAVDALANGGGRIQKRIDDAAVASYGFPNPKGLPDDIRERIDELHKYLTKYPEKYDEGKYRATLARIRTSTGVKIANLIVEIAARLRYAVECERRGE
jgi:hypothetical protein